MDFALYEQQAAFRDLIRDFARKSIGPVARDSELSGRYPEEIVAYARERHAFGRPIAEFQAIQLKLADMATEVQAARLLTWWVASALDSGRRADLETGMAKLYASEVCIKASLDAMRIHGGYGYLWRKLLPMNGEMAAAEGTGQRGPEYEVERFYRDAPLMAIGERTNDILRTVIARQLAAPERS